MFKRPSRNMTFLSRISIIWMKLAFKMGVASTAKIVCGSETRDSHAKSIQPGNHEWITIIIVINAAGSVLSSQIIFAGKKASISVIFSYSRGIQD